MSLDVNKVGWKKESYCQCRNTDGIFRYDFFVGEIASITIKNPDAPELPNMEFPTHIGWLYYDTHFDSTKGDRVMYEFLVGDFNEEQLRMVVFIFDTLYG